MQPVAFSKLFSEQFVIEAPQHITFAYPKLIVSHLTRSAYFYGTCQPPKPYPRSIYFAILVSEQAAVSKQIKVELMEAFDYQLELICMNFCPMVRPKEVLISLRFD